MSLWLAGKLSENLVAGKLCRRAQRQDDIDVWVHSLLFNRLNNENPGAEGVTRSHAIPQREGRDQSNVKRARASDVPDPRSHKRCRGRGCQECDPDREYRNKTGNVKPLAGTDVFAFEEDPGTPTRPTFGSTPPGTTLNTMLGACGRANR